MSSETSNLDPDEEPIMTWVDRDGVAWRVTFSTSDGNPDAPRLITKVTLETDAMRYVGWVAQMINDRDLPTPAELQRVLDEGRANVRVRAQSERKRQLGAE